jgi:hypothetical protein
LRYAELTQIFDRAAVSDIAWRRTEPWRFELAKHWPAIREQRIELRGPRAEAGLLRAWLGARLGRPLDEITVGAADELDVSLAGDAVPKPRPLYATASDLLSAELDQFARDRLYEEAVRTASTRT